ncbi:MAG: hypothetical protein EB027_07025, partial [Actinobacteria bacterium]|nr:hypothetical protein [Actinomycetota bacterium]
AASTVSLYGSIADLNTYLSANSLKLRASGNDSITVTVSSGEFFSVGTIPVTLQSNSAQARTGPALVIPSRFNVPASTGLITLGADGVVYSPATSATGTADDVLTLTISIPNSVALTTGQGLGRVSSTGTAIDAQLARTLTLSGTVAQLNAMLRGTGDANRIRYSGPVSAPLVFSVTETTSVDGAPISSTVTSLVNTVSTLVTADPTVSSTSVALASLPTTLWVTPNRDSDVRFTGAALSGALANGTDQIRLRFVPGTGAGTLTAVAGSDVTVHTVNSQTEIRGTAAALSSYLAAAGSLRYNGGATTYTLELRDAQDQLDATATIAIESAQQAPLSPFDATYLAATARMVLPATLTATPGALLPVQSGKAVQLALANSPLDLPQNVPVGSEYYFKVTGSTSGGVWGADLYTDDSSLGAVALFEGILGENVEGVVKVTLLAGQATYASATRNGLTTYSYGS